MKKSVKILSIVLALVIVIGCFAACGDKEETKITAKVINIELTEEQYAFAVDKNQPELLTQVNAFIAEIKANGKMDEVFNNYFGDGTPKLIESAKEDKTKDQLVVATNAEFPPFEYTEGTSFVGIDMELAALLAEYLNKELVIQHMPFEAVCTSVSSGQCDVAMAGLTVDPDREKIINFSDSYYQASQKLIVRSDDTKFDECKTADDVLKVLQSLDAQTKVGFQIGTTGQQYVQNEGSYDENGLKVTPASYKNGVLAVQDMLKGNVNLVVIDGAPAEAIAKSINAGIK